MRGIPCWIIGRDKGLGDKIALIDAQLTDLKKGYFNRTIIQGLERQKALLTEKQFHQDLAAARQTAYLQAEENEKRALRRRDAWREQYASNAQRRSRELKKFDEIAARFSHQEQRRIRAEIATRYADKALPKNKKTVVNRDNAATRALLQSRQRLAMLRQQATLTTAMSEQEKRRVEFNQKITDLKTKATLTTDQKSLLIRAKEISASLQLEAQLSRENVQRQKGLTALKQMEDYGQSLARRQAQRVNQTFQLDNHYLKQKEGVTDTEQLEKITAAYQRAKQALQAGWAQEDQQQGHYLAGMQQGIIEYGETAHHVFAATQKLASNTFSNLSSMMTELTTTGKVNLKSFATAFLTSIVDIINRLLIAQAIQAAMGLDRGFF